MRPSTPSSRPSLSPGRLCRFSDCKSRNDGFPFWHHIFVVVHGACSAPGALLGPVLSSAQGSALPGGRAVPALYQTVFLFFVRLLSPVASRRGARVRPRSHHFISTSSYIVRTSLPMCARTDNKLPIDSPATREYQECSPQVCRNTPRFNPSYPILPTIVKRSCPLQKES